MKTRAIIILFSLVCSLPAFAGGFNQDHQVYQGDYNNDGNTDFYVRAQKLIILHGDIATPIMVPDEAASVILEQNTDGTFTSKSAVDAVLSQWTQSAVEVVLQDFNIDGVIDLLLKNVSIIAGNLFDQIVFANPILGQLPLNVRAMNEDVQQFLKDSIYWVDDPNYFYQDANFLGNYCTDGYWVAVYGYYYNIYGELTFGIIGHRAVCTEFSPVYDGSIFHAKSVEFATNYEDVIESGSFDPTSGSGQALKDIWESIFGIDVDFDYLPGGIPQSLNEVWQGIKNGTVLFVLSRTYCTVTYDEETGVEFNLLACFEDLALPRPECSTSSYAITGSQRILSEAESRTQFWLSRRDESCDPIGWTALRIIEDIGFGKVTNRWLRHVAAVEGVTLDEEQLGISLMTRHAEETTKDFTSVPFLLSPQQVADYHHIIFNTYGLPAYTFGGSPFGTTAIPGATLIWCRGCDDTP